MEETAAITIGRIKLGALSKLPWKVVSSELSANKDSTASMLCELLRDSVRLGKWDLFREAMAAIPDGCIESVIHDSNLGYDLFVKAITTGRDVPSDVMLSILRRFPSLREHKDNGGNTMLHRLCSIVVPPDFVSECIDEIAAFRINPSSLKNNYGHTPLHCAMTFSNVDVIRKVTDAFPEMVTIKDSHGGTPLHLFLAEDETSIDACEIIEMLVKADPDITKSQCVGGFTALHVYFKRRGLGRHDEIKALLKADPRMTTCFDNEGKTPFYDLWDAYCKIHGNPVTLSNEPPVEYRRDCFGEFWQRVSMLLLAATTGCLSKPVMESKHDIRWKEIDAIVQLGTLVPYPLFVLAAWDHFGHPEKPDVDGKLPLHLIARGDIRWENFDSQLSRPLFDILEKYPDSAKVKDLGGRLPLHIAADSKYHNADKYETTETNITRLISAFPSGAGMKTSFGSFPLHLAIKSGNNWCPDLRCIVEAAPQVLSQPDPFSRLYPFMLAAVEERASVNIAYELLRRNPTLVNMGICETDDEKYFRRRVLDMENKLRVMENEIDELKSRQESCTCSPSVNPREKKRAKK